MKFYLTQHAAKQYKNKYGELLSFDSLFTIFELFNKKQLQRLKMLDKRGRIKNGSCKFQFAYRAIINNEVCDMLIQHIPRQIPRIITFYDPPINPKSLIIKNYREDKCSITHKPA